jgi:hypothetical protein
MRIWNWTHLILAMAALLVAGGCPQAEAVAHKYDQYDVELREQTNTCGQLQNQVAFDTFSVRSEGGTALIIGGTDRVFVTQVASADNGTDTLTGRIVEPQNKRVGDVIHVCKRITELNIERTSDGRLKGKYTRKYRQDCVAEAKPCAITFDVTGRSR